MPPLQPFVAAWSQSVCHEDIPRTPEPLSEVDSQPPAAPRPRFRIKRRNASTLNAPTQQFLASVAAADIPIPSIEEPRVHDEEMADFSYPSIPQLGDMDDMGYTSHVPDRIFSPPKTPAPGIVPSLSPKQYPNWSINSTASSLESSPEYESSRPSTAHSTQTSTSLFSHFSFNSEDLNECVSPDAEQVDHFGDFLTVEDADKTIKAIPREPRETSKGKLRKAQWTKPLSEHLWSTYMIYLQDPKVTPFRLGKSGIPPSGVCIRVAREAKRSWKGAKSQSYEVRGGGLTPTTQSLGTFIQWPHTCASTRAHLRELCKASAGTTARNQQYLAHSPTPYGRTATRFWNRRSGYSPSVFSGQDMAMSLVVSTSESMQLQGPLAQLTRSQREPSLEELPPPVAGNPRSSVGFEPLESEPNRLASPFTAHSYGGQRSSSSLPSSFNPAAELQSRTHPVGPRRVLRSPVRLTHSRSAHKRRSERAMLEPRKIQRPSLGSDLWIDPSVDGEVPPTVPSVPEMRSSSLTDKADNWSGPRTNLQELFEASQPSSISSTLAAPVAAPPRLGSPFAATSASFSFPNRLSNATGIQIGTFRRPFATVQQSSDSNAMTPRSSLATRIAYIDERLRDLHRRDRPRRRSESPL
ncbi:hypothetical protein G7046_g7341 [Stylonectria norvegica]|nr:hypothetical protein G7046_g7341 [Stylonectria norvegica]